MVPDGDTARARTARRILASRDQFDFEEWARLSYETRLTAADELLPGLLAAWAGTAGTASPEEIENDEIGRGAELEEAIGVLRSWDHVATLDSVATTLFVSWGEHGGLEASDDDAALEALQQTLDRLIGRWGTWRVAWGDINRAQRLHSSGDVPFDDTAHSHPVVGTPSWTGASFTFWSQWQPGNKRRYATGGNSYVAVVEFGERVQARSLMPFGQSADPESPHHTDQLARYATGYYKRAWLYLDDVQRNAIRSYRPR